MKTTDEFSYYTDGEILKDVEDYLKPYFKRRKNGYQLRTVGIVVFDARLHVFFPHNVDIDSVGEKEIKSLITVLNRLNKFGMANQVSNQVSIFASNKFNVMNWLMEDFKNNNIFSVRNTEFKKIALERLIGIEQ